MVTITTYMNIKMAELCPHDNGSCLEIVVKSSQVGTPCAKIRLSKDVPLFRVLGLWKIEKIAVFSLNTGRIVQTFCARVTLTLFFFSKLLRGAKLRIFTFRPPPLCGASHYTLLDTTIFSASQGLNEIAIQQINSHLKARLKMSFRNTFQRNIERSEPYSTKIFFRNKN